MQWKIKHGKYWMVQWGWPVFLSIGIHVDFRVPYIDLHLIAMIITIGNCEKTYKDYRTWWSSRSI